jgi:hypothetical protein
MELETENQSSRETKQRGGTRSGRRADARRSGIVLQERDYEVLLWLNEMGPQDGELIGLRFFSERGAQLTPANVETASRRLRELSAANLTQPFRMEFGRQNFYRATSRAVELLKTHFLQHRQLRALTTIGLTTFEHHLRVAWTRIALERRGDARGWRGERRLTSEDRPLQSAWLGLGSRPYVPDAVYAAHDGRKTILELELSPKTERQSKARVAAVTALLARMPDRYQGAHFVCVSGSVAERYRALTAALGYRVELFSELLGEAGIGGSYDEFYAKA